MSSFEQLYLVMKDGTIKQKNPFTGTEVWYVPGRGARPLSYDNMSNNIFQLNNNTEEASCNFCYKNYLNTTPEKSRLIFNNELKQYQLINKTSLEDIFDVSTVFRRISNLYEIVSYDYWEKNYDYTLSKSNLEWKEQYLSTEKGKNHCKKILNEKLKNFGWSDEKINDNLNNYDKFSKLCNSFFGGGHELIIPQKHYKLEAKWNNELCSSGELTIDEHFQYFKFSINAVQDILNNNRFVRYVLVFQNWLRAAGASFTHLHKQLVALDEWGTSIEREIEELRKNRNLYNEYGPNFAIYHDFIFVENDYAVAFADYGHRFPSVAIYSKSVHPRPWEHTDEEIKGISDIVHSVHKAMGADIACNEEWYYSPVDVVDVMPWHILIKWRTNTQAGFEGGTKIYINTLSPIEVRDTLVPKLFKLRYEGKIKNIRIAEECSVKYNMLQYYKYNNYF